MTRKLSVSIALTLLASIGSTSHAQDRHLGVLTATGRFFGIGWTKGGYHAAANQQIPIVRQRHPASNYPSRQLSFPYQPGYAPARPGYATQTLPTWRMQSGAGWHQPGGSNLGGSPKVAPKVPTDPPPTWLKPYLNESKPAPTQSEKLPQPRELKKPEINSPFQLENSQDSSPSDRGLDAKEDHLLEDENPIEESDDDLLLLESDDLSFDIGGSRVHQAVRSVLSRR